MYMDDKLCNVMIVCNNKPVVNQRLYSDDFDSVLKRHISE